MNEYLVACILLVLGFFSLGLSKFNNPGRLNSPYGYRTIASRKNQDTWDEANMYAGKCLMISGIFLILVVVATDYFYNDLGKMLASMGIFAILCLIAVFIFTERRLKKVFFRDGKRRPNR